MAQVSKEKFDELELIVLGRLCEQYAAGQESSVSNKTLADLLPEEHRFLAGGLFKRLKDIGAIENGNQRGRGQDFISDNIYEIESARRAEVKASWEAAARSTTVQYRSQRFKIISIGFITIVVLFLLVVFIM